MAPPQKAKVHGFFRQEESINTIYQIIPAAAAAVAAAVAAAHALMRTRGNFFQDQKLLAGGQCDQGI